jgi:hypothetical protein
LQKNNEKMSKFRLWFALRQSGFTTKVDNEEPRAFSLERFVYGCIWITGAQRLGCSVREQPVFLFVQCRRFAMMRPTT